MLAWKQNHGTAGKVEGFENELMTSQRGQVDELGRGLMKQIKKYSPETAHMIANPEGY